MLGTINRMSSEEHHRNHQGRFKGLFHAKNVGGGAAASASNSLETRGKAISNTGHPVRASLTNDFLPNPPISASPESQSPKKKIWEGAYKNFLARGKSKSPSNTTSGSDRSPSSMSSDNSKSIPSGTNMKKISGFSILPGSKRLVTKSAVHRTPKSVDAIKATQSDQEIYRMPELPTLGGKHKSCEEIKGGSVEGELENAIRGGSYFKSVFSQRASSDKLRHHRKSSSVSDDLDAPLRNGIEKSSSSPGYKKAHVDADIGRTISEGDNDNVGLDYLLETAAAPTVFGGHYRSVSQTHLPLQPMPQPMPQTRSSSWGGTYQTEIVEDSGGVQVPVYLPPMKPSQIVPAPHSYPIAGGSLLSQQLQQQPFDPHTGNSDIPTQGSSSPNTLVSYLSDPGFTIGSSPSIYHQHSIDPETKKVFTMYHNDSRFNRDSTEPFLGGDVPSSFTSYPDVSYNLTMAQGGGSLMSGSRGKLAILLNVS